MKIRTQEEVDMIYRKIKSQRRAVSNVQGFQMDIFVAVSQKISDQLKSIQATLDIIAAQQD